jgi:RNA polymerase sigma-70 factor (ECF subfamily)
LSRSSTPVTVTEYFGTVNDEKSSTFPNTRWSMVLRLRSLAEPQRQRAFEELCRAYWKPLYGFARRCGHSPHDAEDFTQGFFAQVLRRRDLGAQNPKQGRLRTFFKTAFRNFITDALRRETRQKRGGGTEVFSLDLESAERQFQKVIREVVTPDDEFDRQWARTILRRALGALRGKFRERGRLQTWRELEVFLGPDETAPAYAEVAAKLGQTENTIAAAVRRMRQEFRTLLRQEVADTLTAGEDLEDELRYLLQLAW